MRKSGFTQLIVISAIAVGWLTYTLTLGGGAPQLGLDLQGGTSVVLAPKGPASTSSLDKAIEIIRRRVDGLGVAEPEITRQGDFIVVSLPGVKDQQRALTLVGRTAKLQFRPTCQSGQPAGQPDAFYEGLLKSGGACTTPTPSTPTSTVPASTTTAPPASTTTVKPSSSSSSQSSLGRPLPAHAHLSAAPGAGPTAITAVAAPTTTAKPGPTTVPTTSAPAPSTTAAANPLACGALGDKAADTPDNQPIIAGEDHNHDGTIDGCALLGPMAFDGSKVSGASASFPSGQWVVNLDFSDSGLSLFNTLVGHCYNSDPTCPGGTTAIVLDGRIESNPRPQDPTFTGSVQISGPSGVGLSQAEASDLALVLNYGSLPVQLQQQRVETVSATLGRDSLHAGLIAGGIGIAAVAIYMILYYRALGVVVVLGLAVWSALNYSIITYLSGNAGLALSLSGVTGIVVSVGVTTDSYIVYFERMKDEIKAGRSVRSAVDHAFKRAWHTIVAADSASFIGAFLLYTLTVGAVRGFAFFLGLSTLLDLITAYFFKRPMVALLARSRFFTDTRWFGIRAALDAPPATPAPVPVGMATTGGEQ